MTSKQHKNIGTNTHKGYQDKAIGTDVYTDCIYTGVFIPMMFGCYLVYFGN